MSTVRKYKPTPVRNGMIAKIKIGQPRCALVPDEDE